MLDLLLRASVLTIPLIFFLGFLRSPNLRLIVGISIYLYVNYLFVIDKIGLSDFGTYCFIGLICIITALESIEKMIAWVKRPIIQRKSKAET